MRCFSIVETIIIALIVGYGCFEWSINKEKDEQFKREQEENAAKSERDFQEKERLNKQNELLAIKKEKEFRLIKSVAKNHGIKLKDIQVKGIHFMIKEKCYIVPTDPKEIYKFIKQNVLNIKEQKK